MRMTRNFEWHARFHCSHAQSPERAPWVTVQDRGFPFVWTRNEAPAESDDCR